MSRDLPRWLTFGDPSRICERVEEMERKRAVRQKQHSRGKGKHSLDQLRELFEQRKKDEP